MLYEDSDFGKDMTNGLKKGLGAKASSIVASQAYEPTDTSIDSQMSTLHASGANVLVLNVTPQYAILAYLAAHKFGWHPKIYVSSVCISPNVMDIVRASVGAAGERLALDRVRQGPDRQGVGEGPGRQALPVDPREVRAGREAAGRLQLLRHGRRVHDGRRAQARRARARRGRRCCRRRQHLNEVNPFMRPGIKIVTSPRDYYPISKAQLVRYDTVHWVPVGPLVAAG